MRGYCDCCSICRDLSFSVSFGIETWACWECRGDDEPEEDDA